MKRHNPLKKEIHRCRLYELKVAKAASAGLKYFAQVWDTVSSPFPKQKMPEGALRKTMRNTSYKRLVRSMAGVRKQFQVRFDPGIWTGNRTVG